MARHFSPSSVASRAITGTLLVAVLALSGCSGPTVRAHLAGYLPYATSGVDTDVIFPRPQGGASRFLIRNWPPLRSLQEDAMWVFGTWAQLGFFTVSDQPPTLVLEAQPFSPPDAPTQTMKVILNGAELITVSMQPGWNTYEFELPAERVHTGWNEINLDFAHNLRPADFNPGSNDRRTLAARFRRIEMRNALGRPYWPERVEEVRLVGPEQPRPQPTGNDEAADEAATLELDEAAIEMPTDSFVEIYLAPTGDTELLGDLETRFVDASAGGEIHVVVEVVEPERATRAWETTLTPGGPATASMRADLSGWADRPVAVRMRVFGSANGVVRWTGLGTTTPADEMSVSLDPARVVTPPHGGVVGRPDVFVILLDAGRADAFDGSRGADLTPNVAALAAEGTRFTQAWAPSSWTGQTIPALFSGMAPDAVGIETWESTLPPKVIKFPEVLYDAGYRTLLWSQHNIYGRSQELRHGFEAFADFDPADLRNRELLPDTDWLLDDERPTFAFIHLLPPHTPYTPPEPFRGSRSSWYDDPYEVDVDTLTDFDDTVPDDAALRDRIRRFAIARYEENVQFADSLVGRLVAELKQAGRYDNAMIVVIADHGEAFLEHGRFLHTRYLYEEFLHVPFIVKWPRAFDGFVGRVDTPVSLLDLAPTLIDGLGIDDARARYQGRTLMPLVQGAPASERMIYAYTSNGTPSGGRRPIYALRWGDLKLIVDRDRLEAHLYRLSSDPGEQDDLSNTLPFYRDMMRQVLELTWVRNAQVLAELGGAQVDELDEETVRSLRALGYLR